MKRFLKISHSFQVIVLLILTTLLTNNSIGQDVERIIKTKKPFQVNGGLGIQNAFYYSDGISARRNSPYQYFLNGSINFTFFEEFSVPLSFSFSNQKLNYSSPFNQQQFNQFGISPKYKWITLHAGWRNMTFSPYTLSGHTFLGGGAELTPGKFKIKAMYGRLRKAVEMDTTSFGNSALPSYQRIGGGASISYADNGNHYDLNLFTAQDQLSSLKTQPDSTGITPEQNFVWGAAIGQNLTKKIKIDAEYSRSAITRDSRIQGDNTTQFIILNNSTTVHYNALKGVISYRIGNATIGAGYERIDPGYRTLGGYYFNNDMENITGNFSTSLFKKKVNLSASLGKQRNNLDKSKISTMRRWIGSLNIGWNISKAINLSFGYSSFQTYTNIRSQFTNVNSVYYQNIDTLNFLQITQSITLGLNVRLAATEKQQQTINTTASLQNASDEQGGKKLASGSDIYNGNIGYTYMRVKSGFFISLIGMGNMNKVATATSTIWGPNATIGKSFFKKKLRSDISGSQNFSDDGLGHTSTVMSFRTNHTITLGKRHSFTLSAVWLQRQMNGSSTTPGLSSFQEFNGRLVYNLRF